MRWEDAGYRREDGGRFRRGRDRYPVETRKNGSRAKTGKRQAGGRAQRRSRGTVLIRTIAVLLALAGAVYLKDLIGENLILANGEIIWGGSLNAVCREAGDAEETLRELVRNNPETAGFVMDYEEKKDLPPAGTVGAVTAGEIPCLIQWDERWGYQTYGDNMIAVNGCGPTALSMVAAGLTGDSTITPYQTAKFAEQNGYYEGEAGTGWALMTEGAVHFGIYGEEISLSEDSVFSALESGHPVICSMGPGDFTTTGHFIVLTGTEDGKIRVHDPNSVRRSEKLWDYETLESQIVNLWMYTAQ